VRGSLQVDTCVRVHVRLCVRVAGERDGVWCGAPPISWPLKSTSGKRVHTRDVFCALAHAAAVTTTANAVTAPPLPRAQRHRRPMMCSKGPAGRAREREFVVRGRWYHS
jgi:hypothetical protein